MLGPPRFISGESFGLSGGRHASSGKTVELIVRWKGANDKKQMLNGAPFQSIGELQQVPGSLTPRLGDFQLLPGASSPVPGRTHPPLGSTFHTVQDFGCIRWAKGCTRRSSASCVTLVAGAEARERNARYDVTSHRRGCRSLRQTRASHRRKPLPDRRLISFTRSPFQFTRHRKAPARRRFAATRRLIASIRPRNTFMRRRLALMRPRSTFARHRRASTRPRRSPTRRR